jgi:hypothetical protein
MWRMATRLDNTALNGALNFFMAFSQTQSLNVKNDHLITPLMSLKTMYEKQIFLNFMKVRERDKRDS